MKAVAARDPERATIYAERYGIGEVSANYSELVERSDIDLIYISLPPAMHCQWTLATLEAGKSAFCEKPFALNAAEADCMAKAAKLTGGMLLEAYHYRHHRVIHDAVQLMRSGTLGEPLRARAYFNVPIVRTEAELRWQAALGGGALMDLGCYPLHALRTLLGAEPVVERATALWIDGVDAELQAELRFGATPAALACSMIAETAAAALTLECRRGRMEIVNFVAPQIGCRFKVTIDDVVEFRATEGPSTYEAQFDHLVRLWRGEVPPLLGPEDAVAQMQAIDAVYAAAGRPG